ncbi:cystine/glutamate transporter-like [Asterias amurensis]|uniref:cystine/glutamate transporter-like n=1 Tax=Asterias amurensis TaxID=7602 RepID=UPI003AB33922
MPDKIRMTSFQPRGSSLQRSKRNNTGTSTNDLNCLVADAGRLHDGEKGSPCQASAKRGSLAPPPPKDAVYMRRHAGLFHCVCLIVGASIGPNVFLSPSVFIANSTSVWSSSVLIFLCGALCTIAALCYADLITAFKESGGELIFFYRPLGDRAAYIQVWMSLVVARTGGSAVTGLVFASLLVSPFYPTSSLGTPKALIRIVATITLLGLFYVNCMSVRWTLRLQVVFTAVKVAGLLFIIVGAIITISQGKTDVWHHSLSYRADFEFSKLARAFFNIINLFIGWMVIAFIAEDIKDLNRTVPLAMLISLPLITIIYVAVNFAFLAVLTPEEVMSQQSISTIFAHRVLGETWAWLMPVTVAVSTLSSFNGLVMGSGRLLMVASRLRCAPEIWSMLSVKRHTPIAGFLTYIPISLAMIHIDGLTWILSQLASFAWISVAISCLVLLLMKKKVPDIQRPYEVPKSFPITFLIISLVLFGYSVYVNPIAVVVTFSVAFLIVPLKKLSDKVFQMNPQLVHRGERVTLFLQKLLMVVHQEIDNECST